MFVPVLEKKTFLSTVLTESPNSKFGSSFFLFYITVPHVLVVKKVEKRELNRLRNGILTDTWTSIYIQEFESIDGTVRDSYEGLLIEENFKYLFFKDKKKKYFVQENNLKKKWRKP